MDDCPLMRKVVFYFAQLINLFFFRLIFEIVFDRVLFCYQNSIIFFLSLFLYFVKFRDNLQIFFCYQILILNSSPINKIYPLCWLRKIDRRREDWYLIDRFCQEGGKQVYATFTEGFFFQKFSLTGYGIIHTRRNQISHLIKESFKS